MPVQNNKKIRLQQKLERSILHGLSCEWDAALWNLENEHRGLMKKPLLSLKDMKNKLGYWSGDKRVICLNRNFVLTRPWDDICDVFFHEIAHQFSEEVLGAHNETAHGKTFQKACFLLRANPKASGYYQPLHDQIAEKNATHEDKMMLRIKKLLALAESSNQYEAEAAMAKAYALIKKYHIDRLSIVKQRNYVSIFLGNPALKHFREACHLAALLTDFYFVEGIWTSAYVVEKEKMGRVLEISGTVQNVRIADYVHDYICNYIDISWDHYNKNKGLNRYRKTDYAIGIIEGFRAKLESQTFASNSANANHSLVKIEDPLLRKYFEYKYPHTTHRYRNVSSQDENVLNAGVKAGRDLIISKGISKKSNRQGLLIGH